MKRRCYIFVLFYLLVSCKPELPDIQSIYVFPVIDGFISLQQLIPDSLYQIDGQGIFWLRYEYDLTSIGMDSLLRGLDTLAYYAYTIPFGTIIQPGYYLLDLQETKRLGIKGIELHRLDIRSGKMVFRAFNIFPQPVMIELQILSALKDGQPLKISRTIPAGLYPKRPFVYEEEIDISGLKWYLFTQGTQLYNSFKTRLRIGVSPEATAPMPVHYGDKIYLYVGLKDVDIGYARGWFGQHNLRIQSKNKNRLFQQINADFLQLDSVQLMLYIRNTFGVDFELTLRELTGINTSTGNQLRYTGPLLNAPIRIIRATEIAPETQLMNIPEYFISLSQSSNLKNILELMPDSLHLQMNFTVNPLGNPSAGNDFYYGEPMQAKAIFEMPLRLAYQNLHFADTFPFHISQKIYPILQELMLHTTLENYFPINLSLSFIFLDEQKNSLFELLTNQHIRAGIICQECQKVCQPEKTVIQLHIPAEHISKTQNIRYMSIHIRSDSEPHQTTIPIYTDYHLRIKTKAIASVQISAHEN